MATMNTCVSASVASSEDDDDSEKEDDEFSLSALVQRCLVNCDPKTMTLSSLLQLCSKSMETPLTREQETAVAEHFHCFIEKQVQQQKTLHNTKDLDSLLDEVDVPSSSFVFVGTTKNQKTIDGVGSTSKRKRYDPIMRLSPSLYQFFENVNNGKDREQPEYLTLSVILQQLNQYIQQHDLIQDSTSSGEDCTIVLCDDKLQLLFAVDSFPLKNLENLIHPLIRNIDDESDLLVMNDRDVKLFLQRKQVQVQKVKDTINRITFNQLNNNSNSNSYQQNESQFRRRLLLKATAFAPAKSRTAKLNNTIFQLSPLFARIAGTETMCWGNYLKWICQYIANNHLRQQHNGQYIRLNEELRLLLNVVDEEVKEVKQTQVVKLLATHCWRLKEDKDNNNNNNNNKENINENMNEKDDASLSTSSTTTTT